MESYETCTLARMKKIQEGTVIFLVHGTKTKQNGKLFAN